MSLIESMVNLLGSMDPDYLTVHEERCVAVRNCHAQCLRCVNACTSKALCFKDGKIHFEEGLCIGCGTCATVCPTSAIEISDPSDADLIAQLKGSIRATGGHPVIACVTTACSQPETAAVRKGRFLARKQEGTAINQAAFVLVPCMGRIDEVPLVAAAAYGCHDITLVRGACESCPHCTGGKVNDAVTVSARNLLEAFGSNMPILLTDAMPERLADVLPSSSATEGLDRRVSFSEVADRTKNSATRITAEEFGVSVDNAERLAPPVHYRKVGKDGTLSHFVPTRRTLLYNYLKHIGAPKAGVVDQRVVGSISIDSAKCTSCRMCAVFCPTGALVKVDEDGAFGVAHRSAACAQCRLCENICPNGAIQVNSHVTIEQFMGKKMAYWEMERPKWGPNRFDSICTKIHHAIGEELQVCQF